jgi:hypothetical protein
MALDLKAEQLGQLLFKLKHEPRRGAKRFLKDLGGSGSAEELDALIAIAEKDAAARKIAERLERTRVISARTMELGLDGRVAEMLADIKVRMEERGVTQSDVATACGWSQPLVSAYLSGDKEPGIRNLAKLAEAVGCLWRLTPDK